MTSSFVPEPTQREERISPQESDVRIERLVDELERVNAETESASAALSLRLEALRAREATDV